MAQMLRHAIDARTAAQRLDRVHMAEIMKPERDSRSSASHRLCEGGRDRNPRAGRRWKDQVAAPVEAGDMFERRWRQRYDSTSIALAFDNFERAGRLVELRPFQRGQFRLPRTSQSSSNRKASQMRRTLSEDSLNRSFVRQHDRVAPLAQSSDCVERGIAFASADRLRVCQHSRGHEPCLNLALVAGTISRRHVLTDHKTRMEDIDEWHV
jgi:hypothetical protein